MIRHLVHPPLAPVEVVSLLIVLLFSFSSICLFKFSSFSELVISILPIGVIEGFVSLFLFLNSHKGIRIAIMKRTQQKKSHRHKTKQKTLFLCFWVLSQFILATVLLVYLVFWHLLQLLLLFFIMIIIIFSFSWTIKSDRI